MRTAELPVVTRRPGPPIVFVPDLRYRDRVVLRVSLLFTVLAIAAVPAFCDLIVGVFVGVGAAAYVVFDHFVRERPRQRSITIDDQALSSAGRNPVSIPWTDISAIHQRTWSGARLLVHTTTRRRPFVISSTGFRGRDWARLSSAIIDRLSRVRARAHRTD